MYFKPFNPSAQRVWNSLVLAFIVGITIFPLSSATIAQTALPPPQPIRILSAAERRNFHEQMKQIALPGKGCFTAHYPEARWVPTNCGNAPQYPNPVARGARPNTVGAGTDFFLQVPANISSATGSFDSAVGINTVRGPQLGSTTVAHENTYSLQLNAGVFTTAACGGVPGCLGWEQFIFSQSQCAPSACAFIEYWLLNHGFPCPTAQWNFYPGTPTTIPGCFLNTAFAYLSVPPVSELGALELSGSVSGGLDTVTISTANGDVNAAAQDSLLDLAQNWRGAEYNLVGDCCAAESYLNSGSSLTVRLQALNGTANAPTCSTGFSGATAETNNLSLTSSCSAVGGSSPAIVFTESGGGDLPAGMSLGDPHLTTFFGTHYDFQASGEFVLVKADPDFTVHTRQTPASPPTVALNTGVGMKMGNEQVAVCLSGLEVDGTSKALGDGNTLKLPGGVSVSRRGGTYVISRPSGEIVQAQLMGSYINVSVTLGATNTGNVRGLLGGSRTNERHPLEMPDGRVLPNPPSWNDWTRYADSWRVDPKNSLLCHKGFVPPGMPPRQANTDSDLSSAQRERARAVCMKAGVKGNSPLLNDCILDVGLLKRDDAADAFVFASPVLRVVAPTR